MSEKNLETDYLLIKEFADLVGVADEILRYYDNEDVFSPAKRGDKSKNDYRYYATTQIEAILMIRLWVEMGVPLNTIKELVKSRSPEMLLKLLNKQKNTVAEDIRFKQDVISVIDTVMGLVQDGICANESEISISEMPGLRIILGEENDSIGSVGYNKEFLRFCQTEHDPELNLFYPIGGYFEDIDAFMNEPTLPTRFYSLDPSGKQRKEKGLYLIGYTRGYGQANDLPKRMAAFAKKNELEFCGHLYSVYLFDGICETDPDRYLLQVSASVRKKRLTQRSR